MSSGSSGPAPEMRTVPCEVGRRISHISDTPGSGSMPRLFDSSSLSGRTVPPATDIMLTSIWASTRCASSDDLRMAMTSPVGVDSMPLRVARYFSSVMPLAKVVRSCLL